MTAQWLVVLLHGLVAVAAQPTNLFDALAEASGSDTTTLNKYLEYMVTTGAGDIAASDDRTAAGEAPVSYFLRSVQANASGIIPVPDAEPLPQWIGGTTHYRLLPGLFPDKMRYHFDGLATVMKFSITADATKISYTTKPYGSKAQTEWDKCIFFGTGTGPTLGTELCVTNPGVNLLPIEGQLWLTIDTANWGRVDMDTLETVPAKAKVSSFVLNAHPACDPATGECFVQHPCPKVPSVLTKEACFSQLKPTSTDMNTTIISRAELPKDKLIQHSHSPCLTENYLVSKLDAFAMRNPLNKNAGMLKYTHQDEDSLWLVMDRKTNQSRVMQSNASFVNNHFWNCYEKDGAVVVETVTATEDYLDNYFVRNLEMTPNWAGLFHAPLRCRIPFQGTAVTCEPLLAASEAGRLFDYPTYNPLYKTRADYRFFYAIAPSSQASRWFDEAIKVDVQQGQVVASWSEPGVFLTEFDFIPRGRPGDATQYSEDDGVLITVLYDSNADKSELGLFDAKTLKPLGRYPLSTVVPFHAHGIVCPDGHRCYPNP